MALFRSLILLALLIAGIFACGCRVDSRVVYVPDGRAVRLAEDVKAYVYAEDESGRQVKSGNRVTLREGGYYKVLSTRPSQ